MRVDACELRVGNAGGASRRSVALAAFSFLTCASLPGFAFDGSSSNAPAKISPKGFSSAEQALRAGIDDLNAGNAASSVAALTYAAEGGQPIARWKLGEMYADGVGVARDDLKAYHYFDQLVDDYDEDAPDQRNRGAISNAFVAVGVYCLNGIPNSEVRPDAARARELFLYAATTFGNPDAQYNLAHMYLVGAGGLAKDNISALRWLGLAANKGHRPSQALFGHMLFVGDGIPPQRARGLMWLEIARKGSEGAAKESGSASSMSATPARRPTTTGRLPRRCWTCKRRDRRCRHLFRAAWLRGSKFRGCSISRCWPRRRRSRRNSGRVPGKRSPGGGCHPFAQQS